MIISVITLHIMNTVHFSPSHKYKLTIEQIHNGPQIIDNTVGTFSRDDHVIATINRNYSEFPFTWFVKDSQEWCFCGSTYMSQCFINLDTGCIYDNAEKLKNTMVYKSGHSLCWAKVLVSPDANTVAVNGCVWGGEYYWSFYDISDITKGWYVLSGQNPDGYVVDCEERDWNKDMNDQWKNDGTFVVNHYVEKCHDKDGTVLSTDQYYGKYQSLPEKLMLINLETVNLKRVGNEMVKVDEWKSDEIKEREQYWEKENEKDKMEGIKKLENNEKFQMLVNGMMNLMNIRFNGYHLTSNIIYFKNSASIYVKRINTDPYVDNTHCSIFYDYNEANEIMVFTNYSENQCTKYHNNIDNIKAIIQNVTHDITV